MQKVMSEVTLVAGIIVSTLNAVQVAAIPLPTWAHTVIAVVSIMAGALVVRQNVIPVVPPPAPAPAPPVPPAP